MMQNERFQDKRYANWLITSLSLFYMKEALEDFTDEQMRNLHSFIRTKLLQQGSIPIPPGCLCQNCLTQNITRQQRPPCLKLRQPCSLNLCNKWLDEIIANHDHLPCPNISWDNTNIQLWPVSHWEVAKVFQPHGCMSQQSSTDADAAALLTLMMNCTYFHQFIQQRPILQQIKNVRNTTMHSKDMLVDDADMLKDITKILDLLRDPSHLGRLVPCQEAVIKIEELRDNKIDLSLNRELEIKAVMQRTTAIETDIQTMKGEMRALCDDFDELKDENESRKTEVGEMKQKLEQLEELKEKMEKITECKAVATAHGGLDASDIQYDSIKKHGGFNIQTTLKAIDEDLSREDFEDLKFICRDYIPVSKLEGANSPLDLFEYMKKKKKIDDDDLNLLIECLGHLNRFDLVKKLGCDPDAVKEVLSNFETIPKFRVLLHEIAEDIDESEFNNMKLYLKGKIKKKRLQNIKSASQLFDIMERANLLSQTNMTLLLDMIKAINRPDLYNQLCGVHGSDDRNQQSATNTKQCQTQVQSLKMITLQKQTEALQLQPARSANNTHSTNQIHNSASLAKQDQVNINTRKTYPGQQIPNQGQGHMPSVPKPSVTMDATSLSLTEYTMNKKPRGWCCIINNRDFYIENRDACGYTRGPSRVGTDIDAESLQFVFEKLCFHVLRRDNLTDTQMVAWMVDVAHNVDHSKFDCFVCCILTHGVRSHVYGTNGKLVSIKDLTGTFQTNRCPKLAGKPKLFFLQADQGRDKMSGGIQHERNEDVRPINMHSYLPSSTDTNIKPPTQDQTQSQPQAQVRLTQQGQPVQITPATPPSTLQGSSSAGTITVPSEEEYTKGIQHGSVQAARNNVKNEDVRPINMNSYLLSPTDTNIKPSTQGQTQGQIRLTQQGQCQPVQMTPVTPPSTIQGSVSAGTITVPSEEEYTSVEDLSCAAAIPQGLYIQIASDLKNQSDDLGMEFGLSNDVMLVFNTRYTDALERTIKLMDAWKAKQSDKRSVVPGLLYILRKYGCKHSMETLKKWNDDRDQQSLPPEGQMTHGQRQNSEGQMADVQSQMSEARGRRQDQQTTSGPDVNYTVSMDNKTDQLETDRDSMKYLPNEADFLLGHCTSPGYVSFRSRIHGSWYIIKLCELLEKHSAREDLMSILVEVNRQVSDANANVDGGVFKQMPAPVVTLRKKLYFR